MNNNADFLERGNNDVCELSSQSDSDSDSFYLVGGQSDYDSDSFIVVVVECDAKNVQDNKCVPSPVVDEESSEVVSVIKKEALQNQIDSENSNIVKEGNSDENVSLENVHDITFMTEEVGQTSLVDNINNAEKEFAKEKVELIKEESGTIITKCSEECADKLCDVNNDIQINQIRPEDNNPVVYKPNNSIEKDIGQLKDHQRTVAHNINVKEESTDEEEEFSEGEECTNEEEDFTDDEQKEITNEEQKLFDNQKEDPVTATTKRDEDGCTQICQDIVISETKTTEINQEKTSPVVSEASHSVEKEIHQLEDDYSNIINNINNKEGYTNEEEECTDEEDERINGEQEFYYKEEEFTNNEKKEPATATTKHSEDGSEHFSENFVNNETIIKENHLGESNPLIPETNISIENQNEGAYDYRNETSDINIKEECTNEEEECTDEEEECTDEEEDFTDKEEQCTDEEEDFTDEEKFSDDEEKESATAAVKHNEVESDQFRKNILTSKTQVTEIDLAENSPVVPDEKQEAAFP